MRRLLLPAMLAGTMLGCQTPGPIDEDDPNAVIPAGSVFLLQRDLDVPADDGESLGALLGLPQNPDAPASVILQDGEVTDPGERSRRKPFCELQTSLPKSESHVIASGRLVSGRASYSEKATGPGNDDRFYITRVPLQADVDPGITGLRCVNFGSPIFVRHLTVRQIRAILGDIISLELNQPPEP